MEQTNKKYQWRYQRFEHDKQTWHNGPKIDLYTITTDIYMRKSQPISKD